MGHGAFRNHAPLLTGLVPHDVRPHSTLVYESGTVPVRAKDRVSAAKRAHTSRAFMEFRAEAFAGIPALHVRHRLARGRSMMLRALRESHAWGRVSQSDSHRNSAET